MTFKVIGVHDGSRWYLHDEPTNTSKVLPDDVIETSSGIYRVSGHSGDRANGRLWLVTQPPANGSQCDLDNTFGGLR